MYKKLAGMTGTAATEAEEFHKIYKLEVVVVPTNKPMIRQDFPDRIYKDEKSKFKAVAIEIEELHKQQRPVLIGTVSIEKSEVLSDLLKRRGLQHQVLNAKYHEREAGIIAQAGRLGAITVATNMAGISKRAAAMSMPGTILSQFGMRTRPSKGARPHWSVTPIICKPICSSVGSIPSRKNTSWRSRLTKKSWRSILAIGKVTSSSVLSMRSSSSMTRPSRP
jgi:hypothetical protein